MSDTARDELEQVVESAADQVAFDHFVDLANGGLELHEVFAAVVGQRHLGEHDLQGAELFELNQRAVADNVAGLFEPLHADQARAGGQADRIREIDVGDPAVGLKVAEDTHIDTVEF